MVLAAACRKAPTPAPAPAVVDNSGMDDGIERARRDLIARAEAARADSIVRADAARREREEAAAVKRYLVARGVEESRLETVSFGEQRPVCQTADEPCWQQNRRAEFVLIAGAETVLRSP